MENRPEKKARPWARRLNLIVYRAAKHWLAIVLVILGLYAFLSFAPAIFMKLGWYGPARALYTLYGPFCHQLGFRSFYLFGEQLVYPRELAGVEGIRSFEDVVVEDAYYRELFAAYAVNRPDLVVAGFFEGYENGDPGEMLTGDVVAIWSDTLLETARIHVGNDEMGYKVALCERDVAIYGMLFFGGLIYAIPYVRRRLRPMPMWLYLWVGLVPIGLDGFSQLLSNPPLDLWLPRESIPAFRVITGSLFGLANAWLAFPYLEISMTETVETIKAKFTSAGMKVD